MQVKYKNDNTIIFTDFKDEKEKLLAQTLVNLLRCIELDEEYAKGPRGEVKGIMGGN